MLGRRLNARNIVERRCVRFDGPRVVATAATAVPVAPFAVQAAWSGSELNVELANLRQVQSTISCPGIRCCQTLLSLTSCGLVLVGISIQEDRCRPDSHRGTHDRT
jgi:hypothetical protein